MAKPQTEARARGIAEAVQNKGALAAIDLQTIIDIISELIPSIIDCFDPDDGPQAQDYVLKRYDAEKAQQGDRYRGYSRSLVRSMARQAKRAGRRTKKRITWQQAYECAFGSLDDIRTGDTGSASIAIAENHDFLLI